MNLWREEVEDEYERLMLKYGELGGELLLLELSRLGSHRNGSGLGISLSGNKDFNRMSVFVCGIREGGIVDRDGRLRVADELLEVNGHILYGRSHLNAAPIINSCQTDVIKLVVLRHPDSMDAMAVRPIGNLQPTTSGYMPVLRNRASERSWQSGLHSNQSPYEANGRKISTVSLPHDAPQPHEQSVKLTLAKGPEGLGFAIMEGSFLNEPGIYIKHVTPDGPAALNGMLRTGDRLIQVGTHNLSDTTYDEALEMLRAVTGQVVLVVTRPSSTATSKSRGTGQKRLSAPQLGSVITRLSPRVGGERRSTCTAEKIPEDDYFVMHDSPRSGHFQRGFSSPNKKLPGRPCTAPLLEEPVGHPTVCLVLPGRETVIEVEKGNNGLGVSVVGGADTFLGAVLIHEVYEHGAAAVDGRLCSGDQLLEVNGVDLRCAPHEEALTALRVATDKVTLRVFRDEHPLKEEDLYELITVELMKKPSKGLGISIVGRSGGDPGVFICDLVKGGAAELDGRLKSGDQILEVNGQDVRSASQERVATILKSAMGKVALTVGRIQASSETSSCRDSSPMHNPHDRSKKPKSPSSGGGSSSSKSH